jgi:hypothetical protein
MNKLVRWLGDPVAIYVCSGEPRDGEVSEQLLKGISACHVVADALLMIENTHAQEGASTMRLLASGLRRYWDETFKDSKYDPDR